VSERLAGLENDPQGKSYLLHLALNRITLKDKEVRIKGIIPTYSEEILQNSGSIASTLSLCWAIPGLYLFQSQRDRLPGHKGQTKRFGLT